MAIGKPRGKNGMRPVYVYDPKLKRKVYVGSRKNLRGDDGAKALELAKIAEFAKRDPVPGILTIQAYYDDWIVDRHGPGTRRPEYSTQKVNEGNMRPFLAEYGSRSLRDGIPRREALRWAREHPHNAKVVSAMFNDAIDDQECETNPFANRRETGSRERKDIHPLTEEEVNRLADIALAQWGGYGPVARAWVLFGAWVGCRPGETFTVTAENLNFKDGLVNIRRVKKRGGSYYTDEVVLPLAAIEAIRAMPSIPASGPLFKTITGRPMITGNLVYHWNPIRAAFQATVTEKRWAELLDGQEHLDFYVLRHFCASVMADRGASYADIAHQLGNSEQVCRETYVHKYVDRANERVRELLDSGRVNDLEAARMRRGA